MRLRSKLRRAYKSWTLWANGVFAALLAGLPDAAAAFPTLDGYLDQRLYQTLGAVIIGANVLLRFKTVKPLDEK